MSEIKQPSNTTCSQCGEPLRCGALAGDKTCWCSQLPPIIPDEALAGCLCPACLRERIRQQQQRKTP